MLTNVTFIAIKKSFSDFWKEIPNVSYTILWFYYNYIIFVLLES